MPQVRAQIDHTNVSVMQNTISCTSLHLTATHCKSLQITATGERRDRGRRDAWHADRGQRDGWDAERLYLGCPQRPLPPGMHSQKSPIYPHKSRATQCNALQRTATHCNALQRTATNALQPTLRVVRGLSLLLHIFATPQYFFKRALYFGKGTLNVCQRAVDIRQRGLYLCKRALYFRKSTYEASPC